MYEFFEHLLQIRNVTVADVSRATGIGQATLSTWKKRNNMLGAEYLLKIAKFFGVSVEYLIDGTIPEPPEGFFTEYHDLIEKYSKLKKEQQELILKTMNSFAP